MPSEHRDLPLLLTVPDAARLMSVSRSQAYRLVQLGLVPSIRVRSSIRVPRAGLIRWIEEASSELAPVRPDHVSPR